MSPLVRVACPSVLVLAAAGLAGDAPPSRPIAAAGAAEIAPGVLLLRGTFAAGSQPDGNTIVFRAPGGMVVVDTGRHREHTARIVELARSAGHGVAAVVNTHWHLDHIGGNLLLRGVFPDLRVHASTALAGARAGFLARYREQLEGMIAGDPDPAAQRPWRDELVLIDAGRALEPDEPITASGARTLAGLPFELHLETHAVTAGDVWVLDPATRVLVAGDLVTLPAPLFDTACPQRWQEALDRLAAADFAVLVPGHGPPLRRSELERYRAGFSNLLACAAGEAPKAACTEGWLRDVGGLVLESERPLARSLLDYYLDAVLRAGAAKTAGPCGH